MPKRWNTRLGESWSGASLNDRARFHLVRWGPLLAVAVLTYFAFPPHVGIGSPIPSTGQISRRPGR
jgi:hypothetical protein